MTNRVLIISLTAFLTTNLFAQNLSYELGELRVKLGLPYLNNFNLKPEDETRKINTGWVGIELGFEYQYTELSFIALEGSINAAHGAFGLQDVEGEFDQYTCISVNLSNNHSIGRFTVGYGHCLARNIWDYTRASIPASIPPSKRVGYQKFHKSGIGFEFVL